MALFFMQRNNGVVAVIRSDDAALFGTVTKAGGDPFKVGVRIFTFTDGLGDCPVDVSFHDRHFFTGEFALLSKLQGTGHSFEQNNPNTGWDGNVPFSNQEHRQNKSGWPKHITTAADVVNKFELLK